MTMAQLDTVCAEMHDTWRDAEKKGAGDGGVSTQARVDALLFPHQMNILQWQWALKVRAKFTSRPLSINRRLTGSCMCRRRRGGGLPLPSPT